MKWPVFEAKLNLKARRGECDSQGRPDVSRVGFDAKVTNATRKVDDERLARRANSFEERRKGAT